VGIVKTIVTNYLSKMLRSRIHKAAECNAGARIISDKLTEINSYSLKPLATGSSNNLLAII